MGYLFPQIKTGGLVVWTKGDIHFVYRGSNYQQNTKHSHYFMSDAQNMKQQDKGKGKGKGVEKNPIDFIAEDLTCAIVCEAVGDFYQLNCQHIISSKALLSLNNLECPYCRSEIRKDKVYYLPQQTIYNNVQQHITDADYQSIYDVNMGSNTDTKTIFEGDDDLRNKKERAE